MKKILLTLVIFATALTGFANESIDETECAIMEKIEWCRQQGEKLLNDAMEIQDKDEKYTFESDKSKTTHNYHGLFKVYMSSAQKFFELEKEYASELKWHRFCKTLLAATCDDCSDEEA